MVDHLEKKGEHLDRSPRAESVEKEHPDSEAIKEVVEGTEVSEFIDGEVAEDIREDKKKASSGIPVQIKTDSSTPAQSTASFPEVDVMRIQISTQIKKEVVDLHKEASRMMRNTGKFEPFRLNRTVSRIRYLRDILDNLAHATTETVKNLWQKYIKGHSA